MLGEEKEGKRRAKKIMPKIKKMVIRLVDRRKNSKAEIKKNSRINK